MRVLAHQRAGFYNSLLPLSAMIATPLIGLLSDRIGKRAFFMMFASFLLMPVYLLMGYTNVSLLLPLCMMGIAFSTIPAVMWPSVAYIVDGKRLGTAYALMTLLEQIGFFILNLLIGKANDSAHAGIDNLAGYRPGLLIFSLLGFVGLTFAILLRIRETGPHGHGLETITTRSRQTGMAPGIESEATV
jgi:MFS family permease